MEGLEQRKSLRLSLPGAILETDTGIKININNISLEGINLSGLYPIHSSLTGRLNLGATSLGRIDVVIVNQQKNSSGGQIRNSLDLAKQLKKWFDPKLLISNLSPSDIMENKIVYEDHAHNCRFMFWFNQAKKINKVEVSVYNDLVVWASNGWQTGKGTHIDTKVDAQKVVLAKRLIQESEVFPQSFKDWLLDLN
jgi:hypothetical protein